MSRPHTSKTIFIYISIYSILSIIAVTYDFLYYADGAYFAFAIASGEAWSLLFSEFPRRIGALTLTLAPAFIGQKLDLPYIVIGKIYQITFYAIPLLSFLLIKYLAPPQASKFYQNGLLVSWATLGMATFGFPTETWVTLALVWPIIVSIAYPPKNKIAGTVSFILIAVFLFSHESSILFTPIILFIFYSSYQTNKDQKPYLTSLFFWYISILALLSALILWFHPNNYLLQKALIENQSHFWTLKFILIPRVFISLIFLGLLFLFSIKSINFHKKILIALGIIATIAMLYFYIKSGYPAQRYTARTAISALLPIIVFTILLRPQLLSQNSINKIIFPLLFIDAIATTNAIINWKNYRDLVIKHTTESSAPIYSTAWQLTAKNTISPKAAQYYWNWTSPYTSIMLNAGKNRSYSIIIDDSGWYAPMTCDNAKKYLPSLKFLANNANSMIDDICKKYHQ